MRSILVVQDERKIAQLVRDYLAHAGFHVTVAYDGETALMGRSPSAARPRGASTWGCRGGTG